MITSTNKHEYRDMSEYTANNELALSIATKETNTDSLMAERKPLNLIDDKDNSTQYADINDSSTWSLV